MYYPFLHSLQTRAFVGRLQSILWANNPSYPLDDRTREREAKIEITIECVSAEILSANKKQRVNPQSTFSSCGTRRSHGGGGVVVSLFKLEIKMNCLLLFFFRSTWLPYLECTVVCSALIGQFVPWREMRHISKRFKLTCGAFHIWRKTRSRRFSVIMWWNFMDLTVVKTVTCRDYG